ncbi:MAG: YdjC-like protein [uncultured bacterium]|nr:MAG: YdjC-like protein [uncultured bacterium]
MLDFQDSHRKRLLVSADDFGASPRANRNTLYLISLGKINRVGIMVHGNISPKEVDELSRSGVKLDIHLDILHELHENSNKRSGTFFRIFEFITKLLTGKISRRKVRADWDQQIIKFREIFGKNPDGINSHEHVHLFPPFFKIAMELQDKYSIPYVRFGDSVFMRHNNTISHILHYLRKINLQTCLKHGCVSSGALISLDWINNIDVFLSALPEGTIEIACHPETAEDFNKIKKYF